MNAQQRQEWSLFVREALVRDDGKAADRWMARWLRQAATELATEERGWRGGAVSAGSPNTHTERTSR